MGRWYGRLAKLKQELLGEFTRAADLPTPTPGRPFSIRQAILENEAPGGRVSGVPVYVSAPPAIALTAALATPSGIGSMGAETWSIARPSPGLELLR